MNQHRNPAKRQIREQPWSLWLHGLPSHPTIKRGAGKTTPSKSKGKDAPVGEGDGAGEFLLKVQRPVLTRPPEPPEIISNWLESGWDNPSEEIAIRETQSDSDEAAGPRVTQFDEDKARVAALQRWKLERDAWAKTEQPARAAMKIFETLYTLYGRIEREAERVELVLGDGILSWGRAEGNIYHPILLQRLQLQFNAAVP